MSQFGVETSALRPQGKNPNDDMYAIDKGTATSILTLNINLLGSSARLRIGVDNVRRLWKINRNPDKREGISDNVLYICDVRRSLWTPMNCHLDDYVLREMHVRTTLEREYLDKIVHPDNPFNEQEPEDITLSKETGTMAVYIVKTPRNIFCYVKRSNRTLMKNVKKEQEEGKERTERL